MQTPSDTDFAVDGDGTTLMLVTTESAARSLFVQDRAAAAWREASTPAPPTAVLASGRRWIIASHERLFESVDRGATWNELPRPFVHDAVLVPWLVGDELLVGSTDAVLALLNGVWQLRFRLIPQPRYGTVTELAVAASGDVLLASDAALVYRGRTEGSTAELWHDGLPPPVSEHAGAMTPALGVLEGVALAYAGGLYGRPLDGSEPAWARLSPGVSMPHWAATLAGVIQAQGAAWVSYPGDPSLWIGSDGMAVWASGPDGSASRIWMRRDARDPTIKRIVAAGDAVLVGFRRAVPALAGLRVGRDRSVEVIALPR